MNVLILTHEFPPGRGGIATYASQLASGAQQLGHNVTVAAPDFGQEIAKSDRTEYPFEVVRYRAHEYSARHLVSVTWRSWLWSRVPRYDVIHAVDAAYVMALAFLNKVARVPFVATVYGTDILSMPSSRQARWLRVRDMFAAADRVFAISRFTKDLLLSRCERIAPRKIVITPLGVGARWFDHAVSVDKVLERYSIPRMSKVLLTVARLDERKGHRTVLRGIARLDAELKRSLSYVVVGGCGKPGYVRELRKLAGECGANVRFTGAIPDEDLHALYAISDIYCMPGEDHPGRVEGFGLAYLEAAAQGTPSIASTVGGTAEVVIHDDTGVLVKPGDDGAFRRVLTRMLTDDTYRAKLGKRALEHARSFDWKKCARMTYGE